MNLYVGLMLITGATVGKIMLCALAGMYISRYFSTPEPSKKGLSYITMKVFLPCLLFTNLCLNVTWEQLGKFYWAPLFSCVPMGLGFLCSFLVRVLLTEEYRYVVLLGSTFQNGLTFPVSILLNLKGIAWFTGTAVVDAQSYIFLYNLPCSIGLWAVGDALIAWAKAKDVEEEEVRLKSVAEAQRRERCLETGREGEVLAYHNRSFAYPFESPRADADTEALPAPASPKTTAAVEERRNATVREQLGWYRPASQRDRPIIPPEGSPVIVLHGELNINEATVVRPSSGRKARRMLRTAVKSLQSPPVLSSFIAIVVSLTPPLRWVAQSFIGEALIGGMTLIGEGAIPLQLLVLGLTVVASRPVEEEQNDKAQSNTAAMGAPRAAPPANAERAVVDVTPDTGAATTIGDHANCVHNDANACMQWIATRVPQQVIFTWSTVFLRLVMIPSISFLVLHLLVKARLVPRERPFILSMLVGSCSPSAINSSLICAMHNYHARDYSRMIFYMYVSAIFTSTVWLFLYILYVDDVAL